MSGGESNNILKKTALKYFEDTNLQTLKKLLTDFEYNKPPSILVWKLKRQANKNKNALSNAPQPPETLSASAPPPAQPNSSVPQQPPPTRSASAKPPKTPSRQTSSARPKPNAPQPNSSAPPPSASAKPPPKSPPKTASQQKEGGVAAARGVFGIIGDAARGVFDTVGAAIGGRRTQSVPPAASAPPASARSGRGGNSSSAPPESERNGVKIQANVLFHPARGPLTAYEKSAYNLFKNLEPKNIEKYNIGNQKRIIFLKKLSKIVNKQNQQLTQALNEKAKMKIKQATMQRIKKLNLKKLDKENQQIAKQIQRYLRGSFRNQSSQDSRQENQNIIQDSRQVEILFDSLGFYNKQQTPIIIKKALESKNVFMSRFALSMLKSNLEHENLKTKINNFIAMPSNTKKREAIAKFILEYTEKSRKGSPRGIDKGFIKGYIQSKKWFDHILNQKNKQKWIIYLKDKNFRNAILQKLKKQLKKNPNNKQVKLLIEMFELVEKQQKDKKHEPGDFNNKKKTYKTEEEKQIINVFKNLHMNPKSPSAAPRTNPQATPTKPWKAFINNFSGFKGLKITQNKETMMKHMKNENFRKALIEKMKNMIEKIEKIPKNIPFSSQKIVQLRFLINMVKVLNLESEENRLKALEQLNYNVLSKPTYGLGRNILKTFKNTFFKSTGPTTPSTTDLNNLTFNGKYNHVSVIPNPNKNILFDNKKLESIYRKASDNNKQLMMKKIKNSPNPAITTQNIIRNYRKGWFENTSWMLDGPNKIKEVSKKIKKEIQRITNLPGPNAKIMERLKKLQFLSSVITSKNTSTLEGNNRNKSQEIKNLMKFMKSTNKDPLGKLVKLIIKQGGLWNHGEGQFVKDQARVRAMLLKGKRKGVYLAPTDDKQVKQGKAVAYKDIYSNSQDEKNRDYVKIAELAAGLKLLPNSEVRDI